VKILYHHRTRSKDGQSVHIQEMIAALRDLGHDVILVAPAGDSNQHFGSDDQNVVFLKRHVPQFVYETLELAYNLLAFRNLAKAIRLHQPDCIYERYNLFLFAGIWAKRLYHIPLLLEINSPVFEERQHYDGIALKKIARWAQSWVWNAADQVLPVTGVMADIVASYGVPRDRISIIHNGINTRGFHKLQATASIRAALGLTNRLVLGFTGFVRQWHGLDKVIDMLASDPPDSRRHLLVVGDGPERLNLEHRARLHNIQHRVSFTGMVEREKIPDYVAIFDIALQPAVVAYASPLKLIEYLASGKAIVAPAQPNMCELLCNEHNALLFDPAQPDSMANAIDRLCQDRQLLEHLSQNALKTIEDRQLTWAANARQVANLIERLIQHA